MTAELGQVALILALGLGLIQAGLLLAGAARARTRWLALATPLVVTHTALVSTAFGLLLAAFATDDWSVAYVAANANAQLPLHYRLAAAWGGHEGSLLLWVWLLALWTLAVALGSRSLPAATRARVLGVLALLEVGFTSFILLTSNPFIRQWPAALDGRDLNPLLQDPGMVFHPPLLYLGYVGFAVAFALALTALLEGRLDGAWARWMRPWTLAAWVFLTLGIVLGSFWAYYELGWGGWWFWDAVENAALMPWLVGTALLHALVVADQRGSFQRWTVLLALLAFSLSLLGTFLVRSGVLSSVHAFAADPRRGLYILLFLVAVVGGSLALYGWRVSHLGGGPGFALLSREAALLLGNVLLLVIAGSVLLGTLYPLALNALGLGQISVGPPYFNAVFVPLVLPVLALMGAAPFLHWKSHGPRRLWHRLRGLATGAVLLAGAVVLLTALTPLAAFSLGLGLWVLAGTGLHLVQRWRGAAGQGGHRLPLAVWGMALAHGGIGLFALAVALGSQGGLQHEGRLRPGESIRLGPYQFQFLDLQQQPGPNYLAAYATFEVSVEGQHLITLHPEKRYYRVQQMPMTEAAIDRGGARDLYLAITDAQPDGSWGVRVQVKPWMNLLWASALLVALGGLLALGDRRYRRRSASAPADPLPPAAFPIPNPV